MRLCQLLAECGFVPQNHQKSVTIEEALAMTLVMMSHNMRMRMIADRFNHSTETVHRNIHEVIRGLCTFAQFAITPRWQDEIHPEILNDTRFYPWFEVGLQTNRAARERLESSSSRARSISSSSRVRTGSSQNRARASRLTSSSIYIKYFLFFFILSIYIFYFKYIYIFYFLILIVHIYS